MNLNEMRPGNRRAFDLTLERLRNRERATALVKPTRYGKRDLIITACWQAVQDGIVSGGIVFSPAAGATRQFFSEKKLPVTIARYEMPYREVMGGVRQLCSFSEYQPFSNGEFLLAANIQLCLRTNIGDCVDLVEAEKRRTGKPPVIFIDECQFVAEQKKWGEFFQRMQKAEALLVLLTATPYRDDADAIPGFHCTRINEGDERRYFTYDAGDGVHNKIDVWDGLRTLSRLDADDTTTFREAWNELPIVLCKLDREVVSIDIEGQPLRKLSASDTRKNLGKIVRDERFLDPAVRIVLDKLRLTKTIDPRCKAMIVTGNDQPNDRQDNAHAEKIKKLIEGASPTIMGRQCKVRIITLKSRDDDDDESLAKAMEAFLEGDEDIVIVKQSGTVGLDEWRLKVLGYFTPVRSVASMIQTWMRPATPEGGLSIAHLVMPDDIFCNAVWEKLVVEEGGEAKLSEMAGWTPDILVKSYLKEKEEPTLDELELAFGPGAISGFDDSHGNIGEMEYYEDTTRFFQQFPRLAEVYTKAEFAVGLKQSGRSPSGGPQPLLWGLERQMDALRNQINEKAKEKTKRLVMAKLGHYDQGLYAKIIAKMFTFAYRAVGLPLYVKLKQVTNIETLKNIDAAIGKLGDDIRVEPVSVAGPRALHDPRSREYAIQTLQSLKRFLESKTFNARHVDQELQRIDHFRHWEVCGFKDIDTYVLSEVGVPLPVLRRRLAQDLAADPEVLPLTKLGGDHGNQYTGGKRQHDIVMLPTRRGGNTVDYLVRRLKRDRPDIAEALARGEFPSAYAAAIAAGFKTQGAPLTDARRAWKRMSLEQRETFLHDIGAEMSAKPPAPENGDG